MCSQLIYGRDPNYYSYFYDSDEDGWLCATCLTAGRPHRAVPSSHPTNCVKHFRNVHHQQAASADFIAAARDRYRAGKVMLSSCQVLSFLHLLFT